MSVSILTRLPTCSEMASLSTSRSLNTPVVPVILKYSYCSKEYQFITHVESFVERLLCSICQEILCEPVQTSCGHLFCGKCLRRVRSENCPSCRAEFEEEPRRDKFNEREIRNLIVKCQNSSRGCEWEGELGNVESHQNGVCGYQLVQCGNKCGVEMERREVEEHEEDHCELRMYECPYCRQDGGSYMWHKDTYKKVTSEHFQNCFYFPLECPNNCGEKEIIRLYMSSHLCACPEEVVPCRYQSLGCKVKLPRKHMEDHLKDKDTHLDIAMATTLELVTKFNNLQKQVDALLKKTSTEVELPPPVPLSKPWLKEDLFHRYPPCTLRVDVEEGSFCDSPHFFSHPGGYRLVLRTCRQIGKIHIVPVDHPDNYSLKWPIKMTINLLVLNQEEDQDHFRGKDSREITYPRDRGSKIFYRFTPLPEFIKNDTLFVKITSVDVQ